MTFFRGYLWKWTVQWWHWCPGQENAPSAASVVTETWGVNGRTKGRAPIRMDFSTLEEQADTTWKLSRVKPSLALWGGQPMAQQGLMPAGSQNPLVLVDRMAASQLCDPVEMKANYSPGYTSKHTASTPRKGILSLEAAPQTVGKRDILTSNLAQAQKRDSLTVRGLEHTLYKNPCKNCVFLVWRR